MVNVRQVRRQPLEAYPIQAAILKSCRRLAAVTSRSLSVGERQLGPFWVTIYLSGSSERAAGVPLIAAEVVALRRLSALANSGLVLHSDARRASEPPASRGVPGRVITILAPPLAAAAKYLA